MESLGASPAVRRRCNHSEMRPVKACVRLHRGALLRGCIGYAQRQPRRTAARAVYTQLRAVKLAAGEQEDDGRRHLGLAEAAAVARPRHCAQRSACVGLVVIHAARFDVARATRSRARRADHSSRGLGEAAISRTRCAAVPMPAWRPQVATMLLLILRAATPNAVTLTRHQKAAVEVGVQHSLPALGTDGSRHMNCPPRCPFHRCPVRGHTCCTSNDTTAFRSDFACKQDAARRLCIPRYGLQLFGFAATSTTCSPGVQFAALAAADARRHTVTTTTWPSHRPGRTQTVLL